MKKLILLTAEFPLGNAETFLESEFPFLEQYFDSIIFVPSSLNNKPQLSRINSNISNVFSFDETTKRKSLFQIVKSVFSAIFIKEILFILFYYKQIPTLKIIKTMIQSLLFASELIKTIEPEIINSKDEITVYSYWSNNTAVALALIKEKYPQINAISRTHGWDLYFDRSEINYLPFRKLLIDKLDHIVFISENGYTYFKNKFPFCRDSKLHVSKLGTLADNKLTPIDRDIFRIVTCSLIYPNKQVHLIAEALSKIEDLKIEWIHFGAGFQPQHEAELIEICHNVLDKKINISYQLMGHKANSEVIQFYQSHHISVFINASISEGLPVSIMEALSCGIPVIAPNIGGISEILDNKNGLMMMKAVSPDQICSAIYYFYQLNSDDLLKYRNAAFETWNNKYNAEKNFTEFIKSVF